MVPRTVVPPLGVLVIGWLFLPTAGSAKASLVQLPANATAASPLPASPPPQGGRGGPRTPPARDREHIIEGTKADDVLDGGDGDDWLFGYEGHDVLRGGAGHDTIDGAAGDDSLVGGAGRDVLDGGPGRDGLAGGEDNDWLDGGDDEDTIEGGPGNDDMDGGDADDTINGGAGDDVVAGSDGNDSLTGGPGADRILGLDDHDRVSGGAGDDRIDGGDGRDSISGDDGNDAVDAGEGDDVALGGAGDDTVNGDSGNDILIGEGDNDTLLGSRGDDSLDGGDGHDRLLGGDGADVLTGGAGDDFLLGGLGVDAIRAGSENDIIILRAGDVGAGELELIDGGAGQDTLILIGFRGRAVDAGSLMDPLTGGEYRLLGIEQIQHAHLLTSVGSTDTAPASFAFINPSAKVASAGRVLFFNSDGTPLARSVGGAAPQPVHSFSVAPLGRTLLEVTGPAQTARGTAFVLGDQPVVVGMRTSLPDFGAITVGEAPLLDQFMVPVVTERATKADTGVAIFSSTVASSVKLTLRRPTGEEVATENQGAAEIEIPANGHRIVFVRELFPWVGGDFQGAMTVEGGVDRPQDGGPLAGIGLQRDAKTGAISPIPVIPIGVPTAPGSPPAPLYFANVPAGGETGSVITLVNPALNVMARGALSFLDSAGQARAVSVNGLPASAVISFEVPPLGSVVFAASTSGPLSVGSARVRAKEGAIGAVMRTGTAPVLYQSPSVVATALVSEARRSRTGGIDTQLALSATESPVTLTLVLRDARGAEVAGGRAEIQLPPNGSALHTIAGLFPKADTGDFQGTLVITASGGPVAVSVTEIGDKGGAQAIVPVSPLR